MLCCFVFLLCCLACLSKHLMDDLQVYAISVFLPSLFPLLPPSLPLSLPPSQIELYLFMEYCHKDTLWTIAQQGLPEHMVRRYTRDLLKRERGKGGGRGKGRGRERGRGKGRGREGGREGSEGDEAVVMVLY